MEKPIQSVSKKIRASDHESYGTMTILALIIPLVGFILGIVYLTKDKQIDRKLGEHLVASSVLAAIAFSIMWFAYTTFISPPLSMPVTYPSY